MHVMLHFMARFSHAKATCKILFGHATFDDLCCRCREDRHRKVSQRFSHGLMSVSTLQELVKENVVHVVRVCDPTYDKSKMQAVGIEVHDWPFADGDPPPDAIISNWLSLIKATVRADFPFAGALYAYFSYMHCVLFFLSWC
jgi:hypothetical protein